MAETIIRAVAFGVVGYGLGRITRILFDAWRGYE